MSRPNALIARFALPLLAALFFSFGAQAQERMASECLAVAKLLPNVIFASYGTASTTKSSVTITYVGHSTYQIETPADVVIATDYNGVYRPPRLPTAVTMNRAHTTHYTLNPDPRIKHVLHGWSDDGGPAKHAVTIGDVYHPQRADRHPQLPLPTGSAAAISTCRCRRTATRSSSSRWRGCASAISATCTTSWTRATSPRSAGSTS